MIAPITVPFAPPDAPATLAGGRYVLGDVLGRGGVAVTRRAEDGKLSRAVAVKSLVPDPDPELAAAARARFLREARALARFDHPGIVRVYEVFEEGGTAHLVMELLNGRSLAAELTARGRPLDLVEATEVAAGTGRALGLVHAAGMLHRDVSPSNVVLVAGRPVLVDFGLARDLMGGHTGDLLTRMVTPGFSPPEQYDGDGDRIGPPTDVYGLAATLYHALAGRLPVSAVQRTSGTRLEPLRRLRPDVTRVFADGIHDGLELDPAHRPATMHDFLARLGVPSEVPHLPRSPVPVALDRPGDGPARPVRLSAAGSPAVAAPRRWPAVVPMFALAAALGFALPLLGVAALALIGVPVVATTGDRMQGAARRALPWKFVRHLAGARAALGPLALAAGGVVLAVVLDRLAPASAADDAVAGAAGAMAAFLVAAPAASGPAADRWVEWCTGRILAVTWVTAVLATVGALALEPDLLPFAG